MIPVLEADALLVPCPLCQAPIGGRCVTRGRHTERVPHRDRERRAARTLSPQRTLDLRVPGPGGL